MTSIFQNISCDQIVVSSSALVGEESSLKLNADGKTNHEIIQQLGMLYVTATDSNKPKLQQAHTIYHSTRGNRIKETPQTITSLKQIQHSKFIEKAS